jgi:hypothetical protein
LGKKNLKSHCIFKFISGNIIGSDGAEKLGEGVSKLLNLTSLNLDFRYEFSFIEIFLF